MEQPKVQLACMKFPTRKGEREVGAEASSKEIMAENFSEVMRISPYLPEAQSSLVPMKINTK